MCLSEHSTSLLSIGLVLVPVYISLKLFYNAFFSPLRSIPGPRWWAACSVPFAYHLVRGEEVRALKQLHDQFGPVVRIAPKKVSFSDPQAYEDIYAVGKGPARRGFERDLDLYPPSVSGSPGLLRATNVEHRRMRHALSKAFSEKSLVAHEPLLIHHTGRFMSRLCREIDCMSKREDEGYQVDLVKWFDFITFDIIGDLSLGESFNCVESASYHHWVEAVSAFMKGRVVLEAASFFPFASGLLARLLPRKLKEKRVQVHGWAIDKVKKRMATKVERPDFYTSILDGKIERSLTELEKLEIGITFIAAGSETTSSALAAIVYFLSAHTNVQRRLSSVLRACYASEEQVTPTSLSQQHYLTAVIDESLRLFPPVPGIYLRRVPKGGAVVCGHFLPEDTSVGTHVWSVHRSEENFHNAQEFDPDRWMRGEKSELACPNERAFQPFGYGPRSCLGKSLAYAEMRLIIARLLWTFDMELTNEAERWVNRCWTYNVWERQPLMVKLVKRLTNE